MTLFLETKSGSSSDQLKITPRVLGLSPIPWKHKKQGPFEQWKMFPFIIVYLETDWFLILNAIESNNHYNRKGERLWKEAVSMKM